MEQKYMEKASMFKSLAEPNRLMIVDMLSCGELCACNILEDLNISQSTLSHHMKILCECGLVNVRRDGKWMYYSLNLENTNIIKQLFYDITSDSERCICKDSCLSK